MANKVIKGLTVKIGGDTTELAKAIDAVDKKSSELSSELREINKLLKLDPKNTELLAQKQKVLADAVSETSKKLDILKEAERQVQEQFERGEVSEEQVRALQREIVKTEQKLNGYQRAVEETNKAVESLGDEAEQAGDDVEDLGDHAKKSEDDFSSLDDAAGSLAKGLGAVTAAIGAAVGALVALTEESREYRREMGKLETAFADNNHSATVAKKTYKELVGVLGDTDQAVEAANHLANMAETEEDLNKWTDILTGAYAKFGASLPIEGLAEASAEVSRTGILTGGLTDAINWAADANETFGVSMKEATEENEEFNKRVEEATNAEEFFQIALDECSTEQERQALIMETLNKLYKNAATTYKKTNKAVIEANKANDEWNETLAEMGEEFEPVLTEVKRFGTGILKDMKEPLSDVADFVADDLLPALKRIATWIAQNIPTIKAGIIGITAAIVAYKVAVIAAEIAQNGFRNALMASTVAQKALSVAMKATPLGLLVTVVTAAVAVIAAATVETEKMSSATSKLTEEEKKLLDEVDKATEAFKEQKAMTDETVGSITRQMSHVQDLADELKTLADESGNVKEADQARANFIINELNEALGTEYTMTDGVIQKYNELEQSINDIIQAKTAQSLLDARNGDYILAMENEAKAMEAVTTSYDNYQETIKSAEKSISNYQGMIANAEKELETANGRNRDKWEGLIKGYEISIRMRQKDVEEAKKSYEEDVANYALYRSEKEIYEDAERAAIEGDYQRTIDLLASKGTQFGKYSAEIGVETRKVIDALYKEAVEAGIAAEQMRRDFEAGVGGYTEEMVKEAEEGYEDALDAWATAYDDAHDVGDDLGSGIQAGMEDTRPSLIQKAKSIISGIVGAMRKEADSHSPSRKMMSLGQDMDEGLEVGLEDGTDSVLRTAQEQVNAILDRYNGTDKAVSDSIQRGFVAQTASAQAQTSRQAAENATMLGRILKAIEAGQIIALDGKAVVGGTFETMNKVLGFDKILSERGAK